MGKILVVDDQFGVRSLLVETIIIAATRLSKDRIFSNVSIPFIPGICMSSIIRSGSNSVNN